MRAPPVRRVKTCKYCLDFHGNPKLIMPENEHLAKKMPTGDYMCYQCQTESMLRMLNREGKT